MKRQKQNPTDAAAALLIELQRELRAESEAWRTRREDPHGINYGIAIACAAQAEAIDRTLKTAAKWPN